MIQQFTPIFKITDRGRKVRLNWGDDFYDSFDEAMIDAARSECGNYAVPGETWECVSVVEADETGVVAETKGPVLAALIRAAKNSLMDDGDLDPDDEYEERRSREESRYGNERDGSAFGVSSRDFM